MTRNKAKRIEEKENVHEMSKKGKVVVVRKDRESSPRLPLIGRPSKGGHVYCRRAVRKPTV
jgi:hypothetical protein